MNILKELFSGWVRIWIYLGLFALYKGNKVVFLGCLGMAGIVLAGNAMFVLAGLLDKLFGYDDRKYNPSPGISRESYEDEGPIIRASKSYNNVVNDPLEGPLIIDHTDNTLRDEYNNIRGRIDEINETHVKDSDGHIKIRNKYW